MTWTAADPAPGSGQARAALWVRGQDHVWRPTGHVQEGAAGAFAHRLEHGCQTSLAVLATDNAGNQEDRGERNVATLQVDWCRLLPVVQRWK